MRRMDSFQPYTWGKPMEVKADLSKDDEAWIKALVAQGTVSMARIALATEMIAQGVDPAAAVVSAKALANTLLED